MRPRLVIALVLVIALMAGFAAGRSSRAHAVRGGSSSAAVVPVSVRHIPGQHALVPVVLLRIGSGRPVPVELDTGSYGLRVFSGAFSPGAASRELGPFSTTFGDGTATFGEVHEARVTIGGLSTERPVPFGVVGSVGCAAAVPDCPRWQYIRRLGLAGVLGISMYSRGDLENPLLALPAPYSRSWRVSLSGRSPQLVLGARPPARADATFQVPAAAHSAVAGFADAVPVCWQVSGVKHFACLHTAFDTGTAATIFSTGFLFDLHDTRRAAEGMVVSAWQGPSAAAPFWSFRTGRTPSADEVGLVGSSSDSANTGIAAFRAFAVTYDPVRGRIYLSGGPGVAFTWRRRASYLCQRFYHEYDQAASAQSSAEFRGVSGRLRAIAAQMRASATLSLRTDREIAASGPPRADVSLLGRAIAADVAAQRALLAFARTVTSYPSLRAAVAGDARFRVGYERLERAWGRDTRALGLTGCQE